MGPSVSVYYVGYDLQNGYIHNWLVAGPQVIPVPNPSASLRTSLDRVATQAVIASEAKQSPSRKEEIASSQKTLLAMTRAEQFPNKLKYTCDECALNASNKT